jgi:hypothetical protein
VSAATLLAASMWVASAAVAQVTVQGSEVTLRWAAAPGSVTGYQVFVSRNGGGLTEEGVVNTNEAKVSGQPGEVIQVAVRAYGFPSGPTGPFEWGPASEFSDPIRFDGQPVARDLYPLLDCAGCRRFELRDATGAVVISAPHPSPGTWDLAGTGVLEPGSGHALLRERATGALMVGNFSGSGLLPLVSMVAQGFATSTVSPPVDLDADGIDEFLMHEISTGRVRVWGVEDGMLVELSQCDVQPGWRLIGSGDVNGDGDLDLWFDATQGNVVVIHLRDLEAVTSTFISNSVSGTTPVDVADYDGDNRPDLLRRNSASGALHVSLMRGNLGAPTQEVRALATQSGDSNVVPRGSFELDGSPGAEVLLQNQSTGAVDIAHPVDAVAGRRERLVSSASGWRIVEVQ